MRLFVAPAWLMWIGGPMCAAEPPPAGPVVMLPPLVVSETVKAKPWKYAAGPGWEILSRCSDSTTRKFIQRQSELAQLLALVVPAEFQVQLSAPATYILSPEESTATLTKDLVAQRLTPEGPPAKEKTGAVWLGGSVEFMPDLRLDERDTFAVFAVINEKQFKASRLGWAPDAINFLLERRAPALPDWLVAGIRGANLAFLPEAVQLRWFMWISPADTQKLRLRPDTPLTLLPMTALLTGRMSPAVNTPAQRLWISQCVLFVRWALDEQAGNRREALWTFVRRTASEPLTEAVFQDCFGLGYAGMNDALINYLPVAASKWLKLPMKQFTKPVIPNPRLATNGEIAQIKGNWERMATAYLQERQPEYVAQYRAQAERTFQKAYAADERAPNLLAAMGLMEYESGNTARARTLLETAAEGKVLRPRVYLELTRLRYAEARAQPAGRAGGLSPAQADAVLEPLASTRTLQPALPETYELCAKVFLEAGMTLGEPQFAILTEGLRYFPNDIELLYYTSVLHLRHGHEATAAGLIARGLNLTSGEENQRRFVQLQAALRVPDAGPL